MKGIEQYKEMFLKYQGRKEQIETDLKKAKKEHKKLLKRQGYIEKAQALIQTVAKETQQNIEFHISDIVQLALDACWPGKYDFYVKFEIKRNKTEAALVFLEEKQKINPLRSSGGGVVDLSCLSLRMAAWSLGKSSPVIILDEPFPRLSADLQPKAGEMLKELSEKLGIQIIMVTHNRETMMEVADRVFEISLRKTAEGWEKSKVKEII